MRAVRPVVELFSDGEPLGAVVATIYHAQYNEQVDRQNAIRLLTALLARGPILASQWPMLGLRRKLWK